MEQRTVKSFQNYDVFCILSFKTKKILIQVRLVMHKLSCAQQISY